MLKILAILFCFFPFAAQVNANVDELFSERFYSHYEQGRCGENITSFIEAMANQGYDLTGWHVVSINNEGLSVFGMVNAESARGIRFQRPALEERNWFHHIIAISPDGLVYDFDFMIEPTPTLFSGYIEGMFLVEDECVDSSQFGFCVGRDEKLQGYILEWAKAEDVLAGASSSRTTWKKTLAEVLENWDVRQ